MNKLTGAYLLEVVWLIVSGIAMGIGFTITFDKGIEESYPLFLIFVVSLLMYIFRRYVRRQKAKNKIN